MRADGERFLLQAPRDARNQKTWRRARLMSGYLAQSADTIWLYCSHMAPLIVFNNYLNLNKVLQQSLVFNQGNIDLYCSLARFCLTSGSLMGNSPVTALLTEGIILIHHKVTVEPTCELVFVTLLEAFGVFLGYQVLRQPSRF